MHVRRVGGGHVHERCDDFKTSRLLGRSGKHFECRETWQLASPAWLDILIVAYSQIDAIVGPLDACDIDRCKLPDFHCSPGR